jgi:hypothetical protein
MQRKNRQNDIEAEVLMQVPCPEHHQIKGGAAHLGTMYAHQPGTRLVMAQHQAVLASVGNVAQPAVATWFSRAGCVAAIKDEALVPVSTAGHLPDHDVGERRRLDKEPFWSVQQFFSAVEQQRIVDFAGDPVERRQLTDGTVHPQRKQGNLITKGLCSKGNRRPGDGQLVRLVAQELPPGPRIV